MPASRFQFRIGSWNCLSNRAIVLYECLTPLAYGEKFEIGKIKEDFHFSYFLFFIVEFWDIGIIWYDSLIFDFLYEILKERKKKSCITNQIYCIRDRPTSAWRKGTHNVIQKTASCARRIREREREKKEEKLSNTQR